MTRQKQGTTSKGSKCFISDIEGQIRMFYGQEQFEGIMTTVELVAYSPWYRLGDFNCGAEDYNSFLVHDAPYYIEQNLCQIKLLINKQNGDVIGYMALNSDSFILDPEEKLKKNIDIPFNTLPAIKIGKLAVDIKYKDKPYGSFLLWLSVGLLRTNEPGGNWMSLLNSRCRH